MQEKFSRILIGNVLKSIRVEKNIPMKKIASALKVSESTVSQIVMYVVVRLIIKPIEKR